MPKIEDGRIGETPTEARQAEPGPSVLLLLVCSVALALLLLGGVWLLSPAYWPNIGNFVDRVFSRQTQFDEGRQF